MKRVWRLLCGTVVWMLWMTFAVMGTAAGAQTCIAIRSCTISPVGKDQVEISAVGAASVAGTDGKYYIFGILPHKTDISSNAILMGSVDQTGTVYARLPLNLKNKKSVLYRKMVIAVRRETSYEIVSNSLFITNPEALAKYDYAFPKAVSKKGLHIQPKMLTDAEDLSVKHAAVNICLDNFIASSSQKNTTSSYAYNYQGKRYWFLKYACAEIDGQVRKLSETNVVISGILLLRNHGAGSILVPPDARKNKHAYYGFNVMNATGTETLAALMSFLGERYMKPGGSNGTIVNWIVGNEVNDYGNYNYIGKTSFEEYVQSYANSFRVVSTALHSVYGKARVYISLNHLWRTYQAGGNSYYAKNMLDSFAERLKRDGDIPWNLAFHPYPDPLTSANFWNDDVSHSDSTKRVTMKNISYLTDYVTKHFRSDVRIILSEQGFTSQKTGKTNQKIQAAAFAYAYYLTEFNDKIDAFIMNRHVDHLEETRQNLYLGVWTNAKGQLETASAKKVIWNVFKYIDSASSQSVTKFALDYLPGRTWNSMIPGFSWSRFQKMGNYKKGKAAAVKKSGGIKTIPGELKFSYTGKAVQNGAVTTVQADTEANRNLYQGAGWVFPKKLNFSSRTRFVCKLRVAGMKSKYAHVRIRFFSGRSVYEASAKVRGNRTKQISVNLKKWSKRKKVEKIQIWVRPYGKKGWKTGGTITISGMKQAKTAK